MKKVVVAVLATVLVVGVTSVEAARLVTGAQIANSSITGKDIKNKSLSPSDFRGSVRGPVGPRGNQGQVGATGAPGANAVGDMAYYQGPEITVPAGEFGTAQAFCPPDRAATGGGYYSSITEVFSTFVNPSNYTVLVDNTSSIAVTVSARVACVKR